MAFKVLHERQLGACARSLALRLSLCVFSPQSHLEDRAASNEREEQITDVPPLKCLSLYTSIRPLFGWGLGMGEGRGRGN